MMANNYGEASKGYKELKNEIQAFYNYRINAIPFWKEIIDNWNLSSERNVNAPVV